MKKIFTFFLFLCSIAGFSQNITLKGKVTDDTNLPLEAATIYLTSVKDSSMIDYTISNKNGSWEIKTRKITKPVYLKISFTGQADYKQEILILEEDRDFGIIKLAEKATELNEVVIESEIPPIRIKSDTLEFNASSFKVRPDANVETLLKQLPGVDIDEEGKITVNGKTVNQILVNGKPFFDKDGKIALKNLPAEIINKVQVSDAKTKKEELSGEKASGDNASINLTIDEDKNKGFFGRFLGGYGSDKRYESSALVNYFNGSRRISLLASSNNINSSGFSMDDIFGSMGGGRNMPLYASDNGNFYVNGMSFGGSGITRSNIFGLTYSDSWFKKFDPNLNYFYTSADSENKSRNRSETYLPNEDKPGEPANPLGKKLIRESSSDTKDFKYAHNFGTEFEFKIDSTSTIYFAPKLVKANAKTTSTSRSKTSDQDNKLLNESEGSSLNEKENSAFNTELVYNKSLNKRGRYFNVTLSTENKIDDGTQYSKSDTYFYEDKDGDGITETRADLRNQQLKNRISSDAYNGELELYEPIADSLGVKIGMKYEKKQSSNNRDGFNFNEATGGFTDVSDLLTNYVSSDANTFNPYAGITIEKGKYSLSFSGGTSIINFKNFGSYMGTNYSLNKNYMLPTAEASFRLKFKNTQSIYTGYNFSTNLPQANQLLPIEDLSNPLYTSIGNENLNPEKNHSIFLSFNNYDFASRSGFYMYGNVRFSEDKIVSFTALDASAKQTTTYGNLNGTMDSWFSASWNKQIKTETGHTYKFDASLSFSFGLDKGITNGQVYKSKEYALNPKVGLTYQYGELLTINPIYSFRYTQANYSNYVISSTSNYVHKVGIQTTSYWPKKVVIGNDFSYTYNSNLGSGFKKDFFLWNTSVGYNFLNDKLMFKVKVYDLLNQNLGTSRYISPTGIYDSENTVLKRYVMFSLTMKLDKFGTKKKEENQYRFWSF